MRELHVTLETVTPLLLHGADNTAELRPASFRGSMRYWWRAALGGLIGDNNINDLRKLESAVWGNTEFASLTAVRLEPTNIQKTTTNILPHKHKGRSNTLTGNFELIMTQSQFTDELMWNAACASLELALTFGGIGLRARRGYGALQIVKTNNTRVKPFPTTLEGWKHHAKRIALITVDTIVQIADAYEVKITRPGKIATYPCATNMSLIQLCDLKCHSAMDVVIKFMSQVPKKDAFGRIEDRRKHKKRQASPLWIRPIQTQNTPPLYGLLNTVLASNFRGSNYREIKNHLDTLNGQYIKVKGWNTL